MVGFASLFENGCVRTWVNLKERGRARLRRTGGPRCHVGYHFGWDLATSRAHSRALPRRGALIVFDSLIDDAGRENARALLASLNMLIETAGGFEYTATECVCWMRQCGFGETRTMPLAGGQAAIIATKGEP